MRRLVAVLSLLGLTNLVFVQAGSACPLGPVEQADATAATGHEGHGSSDAGMAHEMVQSLPDESSPHAAPCLAMNACLVTLAAAGDALAAPRTLHLAVAAGRQSRPSSLTAVPELPPPRA